MKSEERHELKTNELAQWLSNLPQWAKKNLKTIIYICVVAALVLGVFFWKNYQKNVVTAQNKASFTQALSNIAMRKMQIQSAQSQGQQAPVSLLQSAERLQAFVTKNSKNPQIAILALIKRGDTIRGDLHFTTEQLGDDQLSTQISRAEQSYQQAIERIDPNAAPTLMAKAKLGLGLCQEERGNFEQAGEIYNQIIADPRLKPTVAAVQAQRRLKTIEDYKNTVVFKSAPIKPALPEPGSRTDLPLGPLRNGPQPLLDQAVPQAPSVNLPQP